MTSARPVRALAWASVVLGCAASFVADGLLFVFDDSCPQWEDEGTMAAPHSPYSLVMCAPGEPPFTWVWLLGVLVAVASAVLVVRRHDRVLRALPVLLVALVAPTLLVGLLHTVLPQDCLTGATRQGDCTRDREMR